MALPVYRIAAIGALALACAAPLALAQPAPMTLEAALQGAWQRLPLARTLAARLEEVAAGRTAATAWTAGPPVIGLADRSDRWSGPNSQREAEISLSAPLWLPGQQAARLGLADSAAQELDAQLANARLSLAGDVRERAWAVAAARVAEEIANDHLGHATALADEVLRRVAAGDLARTDGLMAQQEVLAARSAAHAAAARTNEALSRFTVLTGLADVPAMEAEPVMRAAPEQHPRITAAHAAVQRARAAIDSVRAHGSDAPTVALSMRHERDNVTAATSRNVGISVQIPVGTPARNRPLVSAAATQFATASAELAQGEAAVRAEIALASQQLDNARESLVSAASRNIVTREHWQLIDRAFRAGERGLADTIRAQALAHEAASAEVQLRVALGLARARLDQAKGILP